MYYLPQFRTGALNVPGGINSSQTTGIILLSIPADVDITKPGILCLTYANPLDTDVCEWIYYTSIDGSNELQGVTRGQEGFSAKAHDNGAVVAWVVSKSHINNVNDYLQAVTTGPKLLRPQITTSIDDSSGNEVIKTPATSSAVNEITITNSATGNPVIISSTGGDTNIGIQLTPKGTGQVEITANDLKIPSAGNIQPGGSDPKRTLYVPASAMYPSTTAPCASIAQVESSTNDVNIKVLDFDGAGSSKEYAEFGIQSPSNWDASTVTVQFIWYATAGSGTVNWEIQGLALSDDDALDTAYGTLQEVTDTLLATGDVHITAETPALTIGGSPVAGDWLQFKVARDPANDTNASDARLMGVRIRFGIAKYDDQ